MSKNSELIGVWLGADHVFDNGGPDRRCVIGSIRLPNNEPSVLRGYASETDLIDGVTYRFYGHFRNHPKFGRQFNFNSFVEEKPVDEDSVIAYLFQCHKPERGSISRRVARVLFEEFGLDAIDKVISDPVGAAEPVKQWGADKAAIASEYLKTQEGTRRCKLDLIMLFEGRRFPKKTTDRAIREWGAAAAEVIRKDPYVLTELPGIGFKGADKLYCDLARETSKTDQEYAEKLAAIKRQGLCLVYYVNTESSQSGSTWIIEGMAKASVKRLISGVMADPDKAIEWAIGKGLLVQRDGFVASARKALHELEIAEFVGSTDESVEWPSVEQIASFAPADKPLSEHQLDGIFAATRKRVGCLQGSPGVGKTFAVASIVKAVIHHHGRDSVAVAAPTGKAGVRVTQSLAINGVDIQASTIHRMLQVEGQGGEDGWHFHFNDQNPLPFRFIIADECFVSGTMIDTDSSAVKIENVRPGDRIRNAYGIDHVIAVGKKVASYVTKITIGKTTIASSPSHKFFTTRGWVCAANIKRGDTILQTEEAMRLLWEGDNSEETKWWNGSFLRHSLLNEMVDAVPFISRENFYKRKSSKGREGSQPFSELRESRSEKTNGQNTKPESNEKSVMQRKGVCDFEENKAQTISAGGEWAGHDKASVAAIRHSPEWMAGRGYCKRVGKIGRIPKSLQAGSCRRQADDRNRNRWPFSPCNEAKSKGQEKNCFFVGERVDSIETYESGSHELDQYRDADGLIYLYDLQAARHKSYSVEGFLVHNCSMCDTDLLAALFRACTPTTHVLMVGDSNQLAPVGHGRPFFDLQSCIPTGHLTEIRRNSGQIVKACAEIRDRSQISFSPQIALPYDNLTLIQSDDESQVQAMEDLIQVVASQHEHDWVEDLQIVTGKNDGSYVARKPLNRLLQKVFNASGESLHGNPFRVGDKIVCLKNGTYPDAENQSEEHFVANGELGRVREIRHGRMTVELTEPDRAILILHAPIQENESEVADSEDSQRGAVGDWDIGYALSVHRSQGSQWKHVIVMVDSKGGMVQSRNWIYTAISRAEVATWVIGQRNVINQMLKRDGISGRKTFLVERIRGMKQSREVDYSALFAEV